MVCFLLYSLARKVKEKGMREHRPVIALDFPSFEAVKFFSLFPAEESLYLKSRDGAFIMRKVLKLSVI